MTPFETTKTPRCNSLHAVMVKAAMFAGMTVLLILPGCRSGVDGRTGKTAFDAMPSDVPPSETVDPAHPDDSSEIADADLELADPIEAKQEVAHAQYESSEPLELSDVDLPFESTSYPIDFVTALRLAGANHLRIALATERIREACARLDQAEALWIPDLNIGVGYNHHDGPIQDTSGNVIDVSRQSLYYGGGAGIGNSPLTGGSNGPARLFVDLSTTDVLFEPLAARQVVITTQQARRVAENDSLLQVGLIYQELVRAQLQAEIAREALQNATQLVDLTEQFEEAGEGLAADTLRARGDLQSRRHELSEAQERIAVNSAELVRLLRLDQSTQLIAVDPQPIPVELVATDAPIELLVAQGLSHRPELAQHQSRVAETLLRIEQEQWRPWLPHLHLGYAGAGFGGGRSSDLQNFGIRGDFDALAVWQTQNFGIGNRARQHERASQHRQAHLEFDGVRDQVIAEVSQAYSRVQYRKEQMEFAKQQVALAADALPLNLEGIRDGLIRPIEAQQSIAALAASRNRYVASVVDFNRAQLELTRALGEPIE